MNIYYYMTAWRIKNKKRRKCGMGGRRDKSHMCWKYRKHLEIAQRTEWQIWCMCISKNIYRIKYNCLPYIVKNTYRIRYAILYISIQAYTHTVSFLHRALEVTLFSGSADKSSHQQRTGYGPPCNCHDSPILTLNNLVCMSEISPNSAVSRLIFINFSYLYEKHIRKWIRVTNTDF